jgi:RNase P subunit RPR2
MKKKLKNLYWKKGDSETEYKRIIECKKCGPSGQRLTVTQQKPRRSGGSHKTIVVVKCEGCDSAAKRLSLGSPFATHPRR